MNYYMTIKLSSVKFEALSEIARDIGQIFFASMFVGPLINKTINWLLIVSGLLLALVFWSASLLLVKE